MSKLKLHKFKTHGLNPVSLVAIDNNGDPVCNFFSVSEGSHVSSGGEYRPFTNAEHYAQLFAAAPEMYEYINSRAELGDEDAIALCARAEGADQ